MTGLDVNAPSFKLWRALLEGGASEDEATVLMNGYAHELAGRIRQDDTRACAPASQAYFADLIDPEAP